MAKKVTKELIQELAGQVTNVPVQAGETLPAYVSRLDAATLQSLPIADRSITLDSHVVKNSFLWVNIILMLAKVSIVNASLKSQYKRFLRSDEIGTYIAEYFINPKSSLNRNNLPASALFRTFIDDVRSAFYELNRERVIPSSYSRAELHKVSDSWEMMASFTQGIIRNIDVSYEHDFNRTFEQMLFNAYWTNMLPIVELPEHPWDSTEASARLAVVVNSLIDEMTSDITPNFTITNKSAHTTVPIFQSCEETPVVLLKQSSIRWTDFSNALNLNFGESMKGRSNSDWDRDLLPLNAKVFPTEFASLENDVEMDADTILQNNQLAIQNIINQGFDGSPRFPDHEIIGFIADPNAFLLYSQFNMRLSFENIINLMVTEARHFNQWHYVSMFHNIVAIVAPPATVPPLNLDIV